MRMLLGGHGVHDSYYTFMCSMVLLLHMSSRTQDNPENALPPVAQNIRQWREHLRLKQADVERAAGLSHNALSRIETGSVSPRQETVQRIAQALGLDEGELLFRRPPEAVAETRGRYEVADLAERLQSLDEERLLSVLQAFNTLLDQMDR